MVIGGEKYKLWESCVKSKCQLTLDKLRGKQGIVWKTMNNTSVVGKFRFSKRIHNGVIALMTPTRSLFKLESGRLFNIRKPWIRAHLNSEGSL